MQRASVPDGAGCDRLVKPFATVARRSKIDKCGFMDCATADVLKTSGWRNRDGLRDSSNPSGLTTVTGETNVVDFRTERLPCHVSHCHDIGKIWKDEGRIAEIMPGCCPEDDLTLRVSLAGEPHQVVAHRYVAKVHTVDGRIRRREMKMQPGLCLHARDKLAPEAGVGAVRGRDTIIYEIQCLQHEAVVLDGRLPYIKI